MSDMTVFQETALILYGILGVQIIVGYVLAKKLERIARTADNIRAGRAVIVRDYKDPAADE